MAESLARETVKLGMKYWIVTSDRVRTTVSQVREDLQDMLAEARYEYEHQVDLTAEDGTTPGGTAAEAASGPDARWDQRDGSADAPGANLPSRAQKAG